MLHPSIQIRWIDNEKGYGLFASESLPKGTVTWALDKMDRIYQAKQIEKMPVNYQHQIAKYGYRNAKGNYILCWDLGKYMNHSCKPNTLSPGLKFDLAIEDIQAGEEVTTDYSSLNLEEELSCTCGAKNCRKKIIDEDFDLYIEDWDQKIQKAFLNMDQVKQPLWPWVEEQKLLHKIHQDRKNIPSIVKHRYRKDNHTFPAHE
ncbi:MAG: SET domain-containing protein [Bdellovibrionales bacterium]|nr:SET domain-containing protein [Bdellovibrionales bacterium]